jgi:hypothetical protein
MSYFSTFPYIEYEFPDGVTRIVKNISIRPAIVEEFFGVHSNFDTYDIEEGDTPETLAYDLYGDVNLHWTIMLANNILNIYKDWPKTTAQFDLYLKQKYGATKTNLGNNVVLNEKQLQSLLEYAGDPAQMWDSDVFVNDSEYITIKPHHFEDENGVSYSWDVATAGQLTNAFGQAVILGTLTPVSIYDHEVKVNEKKRNILVPKYETIQQMKAELNRIVNE